MTTAKQTPSEIAAEIIAAAKEYGFGLEVSSRLDIVTVTAEFEPGDTAAYVRCDGTAYNVLRHAPQTYPGTTWGTDGASVGGAAGLSGGYFRLNKSGISKRVLTALRKAGVPAR